MTTPRALSHLQAMTLFDGEFLDFYVATGGAPAALTTTEFYEKRPDLGEIEFLKQVAWPVTPPAGAAPQPAASGLLASALNNYFVSWTEGDSLAFTSVGRDQPGRLRLQPGEEPVHPAIAFPGDRLAQFSFRPGDKTLVLHRLHAPAPSAPMAFSSSEVGRLAAAPSLIMAAPVPGSSEEIANVLSLEAGPDGVPRAVRRIVAGTALRAEAISDPIPDWTPLPLTRPAGMVRPNEDAVMAFVARHRQDATLALLLISFRAGEKKASVGKSPLPAAQQDAVTAFVDFYKRTDELHFAVLTVSPEGTLRMAKNDLERVRVLRRDVPRDYGYPLLMAAGAAYEVVRQPSGKLATVNLDALSAP